MKTLLASAFIFLLALSTSAQWTAPKQEKEVPAYHEAAPKAAAKLPPILSGEKLKDLNLTAPYQYRAYEAAAKNPKLIYQLPCYCYCDRSQGHTSLHSCFEGQHGAHCSTCMQEALYADKMAKLHKTPQQIRAGIEKGEYEKIDLKSYR